jgi:hypothetical protein
MIVIIGEKYIIHDAWVVGNEPVGAVDFQGMLDYAQGPGKNR